MSLNNKNKLRLRLLTSLDKVFLDEEPVSSYGGNISVFKNEPFSFQAAYSAHSDINGNFVAVNVRVNCKDADDAQHIKLYKTEYVPSEMPTYPNPSDNYLRTAPGLYPDPLVPLGEKDELRAMPTRWRSVWAEFTPDENTSAGKHSFEIVFTDTDGNVLDSLTQTVTVIDAVLPEQKLIRTEWFHTDCLCSEYKVEAMSDDYWTVVENYAKAAVKRGINTLLTPIFTPPLDTEVGGERPTVQLVRVTYKSGKYSFDFTNLIKWMDMCRRIGVKYLEISHLFTQWGAKFTPKIVAETENGTQRIFGWDKSAVSDEYRKFMAALLPELTALLKEKWGAEYVFFHVSDEPSLEHLENYKAAKGIIEPYLDGFKIIDALSDYEFYKTGAVNNPIPSNDHIGEFLKNNVQNLWTYYCCCQHVNVSNRFFSMPSARCRIIGAQLFKYNIVGFLQWGYNFWYSQFSKHQINPYCVTDAGLAFPSGDAFLVYPGENLSPVESLRMLVMDAAMHDLRALQLLESMTSHEYVVNIIEKDAQITFSDYPHSAKWLLEMRERINSEIIKRL